MKCNTVLLWSLGSLAWTFFQSDLEAAPPDMKIFFSKDGSFAEKLAARELQRFIYLRTTRLIPLAEAGQALPEGSSGLAVFRKDHPGLKAVLSGTAFLEAAAALEAQQYLLETLDQPGKRLVLVTGGDDSGALYGAYRLAEHLGVRFYLHGETVPDQKISLELPVIHDRGQPLFELRGIQPFHDFPEGPDWWNLDDYKAIISQFPSCV